MPNWAKNGAGVPDTGRILYHKSNLRTKTGKHSRIRSDDMDKSEKYGFIVIYIFLQVHLDTDSGSRPLPKLGQNFAGLDLRQQEKGVQMSVQSEESQHFMK